jgi:hypothetical protein
MDKELLSCRADSKHDKKVVVGWDEIERGLEPTHQHRIHNYI